MLTASLDDFSIFGADLGAQMAQGDGAETDLCVLLTDWRAGGAGATSGATTEPSERQRSRRHRPVRRVGRYLAKSGHRVARRRGARPVALAAPVLSASHLAPSDPFIWDVGGRLMKFDGQHITATSASKRYPP